MSDEFSPIMIEKGIKQAIVNVDVLELSTILNNKKNSTEYRNYINSTNDHTNCLMFLLRNTQNLPIKKIKPMLICTRLLLKNG